MDPMLSGTVLIVDDDESVRAVTSRMVETTGLDVVTACDGSEALAILERRTAEITCVLLDAVMPVMNGRETFRRLRRLRRDVPVIVMSGYGADVVNFVDVSGDLPAFLAKPCSLAEMRGVLFEAHRALAGAS